MPTFRRLLPAIVLIAVTLIIGLLLPHAAEAGADITALQTTAYFDNRTEPVYLMASLVNAINTRDYLRAWNYWETTPPGVSSYDQFAAGYADTQEVSAFVQLPIQQDAGAGHVYATVPTLFNVRHTDGRRSTFVGCYTLHKTNVPVGDNPLPDPNWSIREGRMRRSTPDAFLRGEAICDYTPTFATDFPIDQTGDPVDLLVSYFNAVMRREYVRAYNYWLRPPRLGQLLNDFALGYADTQNVTVFLNLNIAQFSNDGTLQTNLPVAMRSTLFSGAVQYFGGCYQAQYQVGTQPRWAFINASVQSVSTAQGSLDVARCN